MARMNLYVPDDLKKRMDALGGVAWSPLACKAFAAFLDKSGEPKSTADELLEIENEAKVLRERLRQYAMQPPNMQEAEFPVVGISPYRSGVRPRMYRR
jgi:hypothetical protein